MRALKEFHYNREEKFFIFYFPIINAVFFSFINVIPKEYRVDIIRGIFSFIVIIYFLSKKKLIVDKPGKTLYVFTVFVVLMSLVTLLKYNYFDKVVIKVIIASSLYYVGYAYINNYRNFVLLINGFYISLITILFSIIFLKALGIRMPDQYGIGVELGAQGVNTTKILPIFFFPLLIKINLLKLNNRKKIFHYLIIGISIIIILLGMKRGAVIGLSFAFLLYLLYSGKKGKAFRTAMVLIIFTLLLSTFFWEKIIAVYTVRAERYNVIKEEKFDKEARYYEMQRTLNNISMQHPWSSIFGHGFRSEFFVFNVSRMFHTDYMVLLHGTGILGLFLYLLFYYQIFQTNRKKIYSNHPYFTIIRETSAISIALIVYLLFVGISGAIHEIDLRGFALLFLGASNRLQNLK